MRKEYEIIADYKRWKALGENVNEEAHQRILKESSEPKVEQILKEIYYYIKCQ